MTKLCPAIDIFYFRCENCEHLIDDQEDDWMCDKHKENIHDISFELCTNEEEEENDR